MAGKASTDLSTTDSMDVDVAQASFEDLDSAGEYDETQGLTVVDKAALVGVPFFVTAVRFSPGKGRDADFVSCEITTRDVVNGDRRFVLNDGSTGIRRQIVGYLTSKGWIDPGEGAETGKSTRYDNPCDKWDYKTQDIELRFGEDGRATCVVPTMRLKCKGGLRRSDYTGPEGEATTFYLA